MESLTPKQIVAELDKYIVGQQAAKRAVAGSSAKPLSASAVGRCHTRRDCAKEYHYDWANRRW